MKEPSKNQLADAIDECVTNGIHNGILHLNTQNDYFDGRIIRIKDKDVVNFGSCSYLGLEVDDRLKQGTINAALKYGTQFSSSRFYISCGLYVELENLISQIFGAHALVAPSTSVAHAAAIPILVNDNDAIILDHQAHASMQNAVSMLHVRGIKIEMIRHNDLEMLEEKIKELSSKHYRIWYLADSVYSMYGDYAPVKDIYALLNKYPQFFYYVDDAHGMSCTGKNGSGYILSQVKLHPKMIVTSSMAKGFGTGGGILVSPDPEIIRKIQTCGSNLIFSGPIQPPMLGASIASAKIHLSPEINELQKELKDRISYCDQLIREKKLPYVLPSASPIMYLALGLPRTGYNMINRLIEEGFYVDTGLFPAVSLKRTGIRIPINKGQRMEDIKNLMDAIEHHYPLVLEEEKQSIEEIGQYFKMDFSYAEHLNPKGKRSIKPASLKLNVKNTIMEVDKEHWDSLLGDRGSFDWEGCKFLEEVFVDNPEPENNWKFFYFDIKDDNNKSVITTFFTLLLCKDDMLSPESVSAQVEELRKKDPYYLTSKVIMMGSLLTEGEHLYIDRTHPQWKDALVLMIEEARRIQEQNAANAMYLRDFDTEDTELRDFLIGQGFVRTDMPDAYIVEKPEWKSEEEFLERMTYKSRKHQRKEVLSKEQHYKVKLVDNDEDVDLWNKLYMNVKSKSLKLNTFDLPKKIYPHMLKHKNWQILELRLTRDSEGKEISNSPLASIIFSYKSKQNLSPIFIGIDYNYNSEFKVYRQSIYQILKLAVSNNSNRVYFGMEAGTEKKKFGATPHRRSNYIQVNESFNMETLNLYNKK